MDEALIRFAQMPTGTSHPQDLKNLKECVVSRCAPMLSIQHTHHVFPHQLCLQMQLYATAKICSNKGMLISKCVSAALPSFALQHCSRYVASGIATLAEYIAAEILELSGNVARHLGRWRLRVSHIKVPLLQRCSPFRYIGMLCDACLNSKLFKMTQSYE